MKPGSPYHLISEMLETPGILRRFDQKRMADWAETLGQKRRLLITGEGSSRIFPAKNMISLALQRGVAWQICTEGAEQAAEYDLRDFSVIGASNSGRTRELITLFEKLGSQGISCYGITAAAQSRLAETAADMRLLSCGAERAVAATKSVVEQALIYQALLGGDEWKNQAQAADQGEAVLTADIAPEIIDSVRHAAIVYFSGRNNGVAEELTLKANEILRRKSDYLEGTYAVHGIEEVMQKDETVILVEPFRAEMEKYQKILAAGVGLKIVAIASFDTPFPTVKIPDNKDFGAYLQLLAGWNILVAAGLANGIDLDKPVRARKVGNEI